MKKHVLISEHQTITRKAEFFMERDDNNVCLPGKKDVHYDVKVHTEKKNLNGYIYILHKKFLAENSNTKISLTVLFQLFISILTLTSLYVTFVTLFILSQRITLE